MRNNTCKYTWSILFLSFLLVLSIYFIGLSGTVPTMMPMATGTSPMGTTMVNITPSSQFVSPGETFKVNITVDPSEPIHYVGADISFNSSLITAEKVAVGNLFDPYLQFPDNGTIDNTVGTITGMNNVIIGDDTVSSLGTFMEITFKTRSSAGNSYLNLSNVMVLNVTGVPFTVNNGSIMVTKTYVNITPSSQFVLPNETFTVNITIDPVEPIHAVGAYLSFDPSLITADSVAVGDLFDPHPHLTCTGLIDNTVGTIIWMFNIISGTDTVSSPGTFMEIAFTAGPLPGNSYLNLSNVMIVNVAGIPFTVNNGMVTIDTIPPVTKKTVGEPKYNVSDDWYVKSSTEFNLTATDDAGVEYIKYRIWSTTSGWTDWVIYDGNFTLPNECIHYLEYYAVDKLGNEELPHHNQTYYLDDTAPEITKDVGEPNVPGDGFTWITSDTEFTLSAVDAGCMDGVGVGVDTLEYRIWYDGSWSDWTIYSTPFTMSGECIHYLEVRAKDKLGNGELLNQTYYLDDTPPEITKDVGGPKYGGFVTTSTEIILDAIDAGCMNGVGVDTLEYRIWYDGSWTDWNTYTNPFKMNDECIHYLEVRAKDKLGNGESLNQTYYLDDTAPTSSVGMISPYWHNETLVPFEIIADASDDGCEGGSGVEKVALYYRYSIDNLSWSSWTVYDITDTEEPYNWSFTGSDGYYQFYSISKDNVANVENPPTTADAIVGIDTTPPTIEVIYPKGGENISAVVTIKWNATDIVNLNGTIWIQYSDDNGSTWNEIARELDNTGEYDWDTTTVPDESEYLIMVNATDDIGNTNSNESSSVFTIDNTLPETTCGLSGTMGENGWYISNVTVTLDATDALSGVDYTEYKINGGPWKTYTTPFTISTDGSHIVRYYSVDNAGNVESTNSITIKRDRTVPTISIERPRGYLYIFDMEIIPLLCNKTRIIGSITIKVNATDDASGIDKVYFFIDNKSKYNDTEFPYNWSCDETAFFRHSIKVMAYDKAGNEATDEIEVVIFNIKN